MRNKLIQKAKLRWSKCPILISFMVFLWIMFGFLRMDNILWWIVVISLIISWVTLEKKMVS